MTQTITDEKKVAIKTEIEMAPVNETALNNEVLVDDTSTVPSKNKESVTITMPKELVKTDIPKDLKIKRRKRKMQRLARKISRGSKNAKRTFIRLQRSAA